MKTRKIIAIVGLAGIATAGYFGATYHEEIASRIGLQKPPYRVIRSGDMKAPFLVDTKTGMHVEIYQGRIGPQLGNADYIVNNAKPEGLQEIARKSILGLNEEGKLEITVTGLKEISEENRRAAIEKGLDYCSAKTEALIVGHILETNVKEGYEVIIDSIKGAYGATKDSMRGLIEKYSPDSPGTVHQGQNQQGQNQAQLQRGLIPNE